MENNDFKDAKVGDRVWDLLKGWGEVASLSVEPVTSFNEGKRRVYIDFISDEDCWYSQEGNSQEGISDKRRTLFWDEVIINPPPKPKKRVKKVVEGWINVYGKSSISELYELKENALNERASIHLGEPLHIKHEYWEDE